MRLILRLVLVVVILGLAWWIFRSPDAPERPSPVDPVPEAPTEVDVYFGHSELAPVGAECQEVFAVRRRLEDAPTPARGALQALLAGPTLEEEAQGYFTSINPEVGLRSLVVEDGVARVDFDAALDRGVAGSCRVIAIRTQIERTLLQFPSIREVEISVEGFREGVLQP